jgi:hypothetical protein
MDLFLIIINWLVTLAVLITAVRMYLLVNKLWKRKHERAVSESISIMAYTLAIVVHTPFMCKFIFIDHATMPALNDAIQIISYVVVIIIGAGFWVKENRNIGFFKLVMKALHLEGKESGDLIKSLIQPSGAEQIMNILKKVAYIDNELAEAELKLINGFAQQWKLDLPEVKDWETAKNTNLLDIRESVNEYLNLTPPPEQAAELIDVISLLIKSDAIVTEEEELFLGEFKGMINDYIQKNQDVTMYHVLIVPQNETQFNAAKTLFPDSTFEERRGGNVLVRGHFYSKNYAEAICQKYISLGMFSIWEECKTAATA